MHKVKKWSKIAEMLTPDRIGQHPSFTKGRLKNAQCGPKIGNYYSKCPAYMLISASFP